ncbi:alpha-1,2-mannosyltransferase Mnn22p [[Candida] jaroonii]|uniref:Alpha-1,2-mannosyltransferase Mnn22p n=1 Tax=[Candida] jaroonii TaxID=467808 RepID=A0ACA9YFJ2_9ASCO|nr:alpha-1,2-mannosyltransferase Mnn22p [[Candida] jaroonii]
MRLRIRLLILVSIFSVIAYIGYISSSNSEDLDYLARIKPYIYKDSEPDYKPIVGQVENDPRHQFWDKIFDIFDAGDFNLEGVNVKDAIEYVAREDQIEGPDTKNVLLSKAKIKPGVFDELKNKHNLVKSQLPKKLAPSTYKSGSSGIVLIGGIKFSWLSYLSLVALRKAGSKLPVEIIMPQHDDFVKEQEFCTTVLPRLNAACVVLPDVLGASVMVKWSSKMATYQLKSLALMVSSFQNVLLLDSDNIVVQNPDKLFESKLFKTHGMITWPDYWKRSISPLFYDIAGISVNERKRVRYGRFPLAVDTTVKTNVEEKEDEKENVPYHDLQGTIPDLSTESGQFLINKDNHACTLLLSMYYNMMGPNLYYKLFSLGAQGEGDKDTFPAAAVVCKDNFYQVKSFIKTFGYFDDKEQFQGVAMGQKDPLVDFNKVDTHVIKPSYTKELKSKPIEEQIERIKTIESEHFDQDSLPLFTVHCNYPKLDPINLMDRKDMFDEENYRLKYRLYSDLKYNDPNIKNKLLDFELEQWKNIDRSLCEESISFVHFKNHNIEEICKFAKAQVKWLNGN